jgi:Xaa-Pro aminopeptidase
VKQKDLQNIVEAISFIESELQKDQLKLCKKVEEIQKMMTAINIRVAELESSLFNGNKGITESNN